MEWRFLKAKKEFEQYREHWDALNRQAGHHILMDSRFVAPLLKHFASDEVILAVCEDDPAAGMAFLVKDSFGVWSTFQPSQSPLGLILIGRQRQPYETVAELMESIPGYAVLLGLMQQDPLYSPFSNADAAPHIEFLDYIDTPRLELTGTFQSYWEQRGKNLKHNLERQSRRLNESGRSLQLVTVRDAAQIAECIREYGRLESEGWKGKEGSAIEENNSQGRFYREIFEDFCATGEGVVYQLLLDDKVVASDLCLLRNGMLVVLKTTYDEKVEKCSPALLMRREITRQLFDEGVVRVIEFYGKVRDWHMQWTTDVRRMFHLNLFRNAHIIRTRNLLKTLR
jgi:GNAT acetyltransferase-like protein